VSPYHHGYPQRVRCKHCGKFQVENFTDKGKIYPVGIGSQYSVGTQGRPPGWKKAKTPSEQGKRILREYAEAMRQKFFTGKEDEPKH